MQIDRIVNEHFLKKKLDEHFIDNLKPNQSVSISFEL